MDIRPDDLPSKEINNPDGEYGEKFEYDPDFKGPLHEHSCTDVVFLFLWIVFIFVWISIGCVAFVNGDPNKLLHPKDSSGKRCGLDESVKNRPYLMYFDLSKCVSRSSLKSTSDCPKVCVSECPNKHFEFNGVKRYNDTINDLYCTPGTKEKLFNMKSIENAINSGECAAWYVPSQLVGKRCLPVSTIDSTLLMRTGIDKNDVIDGRGDGWDEEMVLSTLEKHWPWIAVFMCITEFVCIIYIMLISRFATFMVWFSVLAAVGFGLYCVYTWYMMYKNAPEDSMVATVGLTLFVSTIIVLLILLFIILFLRKKLNLAIGLIREASRAVNALKSTLAFPVLVWVLQCIIIAWSIAVSFYLFSCGEETYICDGEENKTVSICDPNKSPSNCENCTEGEFKYEEYVMYLQVMNLFGFFWGTAFVVGFSEMTLAGAFATWYWTFKKEDVSSFAVLSSIHRTVRYHLGTVAFGSLILAICKLIRVLLRYISEKAATTQNGLLQIILAIMSCLFWCLEKFIKFVNRNAYIICAIHGNNFCKSARTAFNLIMRNILRSLVLYKVSDLLLLFGAVAVAAAMMGLSRYVFMDENEKFDKYNWISVLLVGFGSFFIAVQCFGVLSMAVDTVFLCFLEDLERNDGSRQKPYYMSRQLLLILAKKD